MRQNENTCLYNEKTGLLLTPYKPEHVPPYHAWMQDAELLEQTASELLSLDEEYENQTSWHEDSDKLTFILHHSLLPDATFQTGQVSPSDLVLLAKCSQADMIGDINIFYTNGDFSCGELSVMLAVKAARSRGFGKIAVLMIASYVRALLETRSLRVKISADNTTSLKFFESIGFVKESLEPDYFKEFALSAFIDHLPAVTYKELPYSNTIS